MRSKDQEAPQTPEEELLAQLWSAVLKVAAVGREENFFELGGHSLLARQLISRVREVFQVEVPLRTIFERPTVAGMVMTIQSLKQNHNDEKITRLIESVAELSDTEAAAMLEELEASKMLLSLKKGT